MNLKEIINKAYDILGLEGEPDYDNPSRELQSLIDSAKMVFSELTLEHLPLKTEDKITFIDGRASYILLNKECREILSVTVGGNKIPFKTMPTFIQLQNEYSGLAEVNYLYHVTNLTLESILEIPPCITTYILACGTVGEYYYRQGMVNEALFYNTRFANSLVNALNKKRSFFLPSRRLIW